VPFDPVEQHGAVRIGWNDCCWVTGRELGNALGWKIYEIIKVEPRSYRSSGVGRQISRRLHAYGNTMYGVNETLLLHGDHESVMHPEERKTEPLIT